MVVICGNHPQPAYVVCRKFVASLVSDGGKEVGRAQHLTCWIYRVLDSSLDLFMVDLDKENIPSSQAPILGVRLRIRVLAASNVLYFDGPNQSATPAGSWSVDEL